MTTEANEGFDPEEYEKKLVRARKQIEKEEKMMNDEKKNLRKLEKEGKKHSLPWHRSHIAGREPHNKQKDR